MLIGVLADTHDNLVVTGRALEELRTRAVEALLHAGDYIAPFSLKLLVNFGIPFLGVFGNNDGEKKGLAGITEDLFPGPHRFEMDGRRIVMAHEPEVLASALAPGDDLAVCGHTHRPEISVGPPLVLNPGEVGGWLTGRCTGAIVDLKDMTAEIIEFGKQERPIP